MLIWPSRLWTYGAKITLALALTACTLWAYVYAQTGANRSELAQFGYFEDHTALLSLPEISEQIFVPFESYFARGFSSSAHWVRLAATAQNSPSLLTVELPNLDDVRLYTQDADGHWTETRSGDSVPYADRPWASPFLGFVLNKADLERTAYLRITSTGTNAVSLNLRPLTEGIQKTYQEMIIHAAIFGVQLMAISACIALYIVIRDRVFIWFVLNQIIWLVAFVLYNGYASILLQDYATNIAYSIAGSVSFLVEMIFHLLVIRRFAPARSLFVLAAVIATTTPILVFILWQIDISLALETRSALTLIFIFLLAFLAATSQGSPLMPLLLLKLFYFGYVALVSIWFLPLLGLTGASSIALHAVTIHGTVNLTMILIFILFTVLSERKIAQQRQSELAEHKFTREVDKKTIEAQESLVHMLSHEVRTTLAIIRIAISKGSISPRNVAQINKAIDGLDTSIGTLVDGSRVIAGEIEVHFQPTEPLQVVLEVMETIGSERVALLIDSRAEGLNLNTDPILLRIIIQNLLENAVKYAAEETQVNLSLDTTISGGIRASISNTLRPGPLPDIDRLKDRYYRDPHVVAVPGTGIGLSVVADLVERIGGSFDLSIKDRNFIATLVVNPC